ncbi:MAG: peptidylprolyl isomerase [Rhodobacteraceae bacterium PARR1]|nr:MAG: peptidylprolyl isomerase [Rhodobacteraceae bacterium PARR1]
MAKETDDDAPRKKRKTGSVLVWVLLAMIVTGLGGYQMTNFGGTRSAIGTVGEREIDAGDYGRALRQEVDALGAQFGTQVPLDTAIALGVDQKVIQTLVNQAALDNEAARIGISVGDPTVAQQITDMRAFQGTAGQFDRTTYSAVLKQNNLTEAAFEARIRDDLARGLLQGAVVGGYAAPKALTDTLANWAGERRGFSLLRVTEADLTTPVADPTDADLQAFYDANPDSFINPEAKRITYAALLPEAIRADQPVDEAALQKAYDDRIDEFMVPEKRLVERLVYPDQTAADAAKARLDAGDSFDTLVADRGLRLEDVDMGDVAKSELGAAGDAVFALTEPGVVGPLATDLGPALFRMNAVLAAQETTFDQAKDDLAAQIQVESAKRAISDRFEEINDLLAGGATLEDLSKEPGMEVATIDYVPGAAAPEGIAAYPDFRAAADKVADGDFPEAVGLTEGGLFALRLDEIVPAAPIPFAEAKAQVETAWRADALAKALSARASEIAAAVQAGASLGSQGIVTVTRAIGRDGTVADAPETLVADVFKMATGAVQVIDTSGFTAVVQLDRVVPLADLPKVDADALRDAISVQVEQALSQDAAALFTQGLASEAGVRLDQQVISAVNAQMQ